MDLLLLVSDPSGLNAMWNSLFGASFQGNYILLGLLLLIVFVYFAVVTRMRSGAVVVTGLGLVYFLSIFNSAFQFLFYLAIIVSVIVFVMGIKTKTR